MVELRIRIGQSFIDQRAKSILLSYRDDFTASAMEATSACL